MLPETGTPPYAICLVYSFNILINLYGLDNLLESNGAQFFEKLEKLNKKSHVLENIEKYADLSSYKELCYKILDNLEGNKEILSFSLSVQAIYYSSNSY